MNNMTKSELRIKYKNIRNNVNSSGNKNELIKKSFCEFFLKKYKTYFVYKSFSSEVDTEGIIKDLFDNKKTVLIPKCNTETETMNAVEIFPENSFNLNTYGIPEVSADCFFEGRIDVIIIPGLVFDKKGNRIGYGKGYYDKFINSLNYKPKLVGLAYDEQIINSIDSADEHDAKLDYLITDKEIYKFQMNLTK